MATTHNNFVRFGSGSDELILEFVFGADVADTTRTKYRKHLHDFVRWLVDSGADVRSDVLLGATAGDVHRFLATLRDAERPGGPLSPSSRKSYLGSLRSFYRYCKSVHLLASDPTDGIKPPKIPRTPGMHLTAQEIRRLLDVQTNPRDRIQTYLLAFTAARSGELRNLRWSDVDFSAATIVLHGKGGRTRTVDIHPMLAGELRRWFVHQEIAAQTSREIAAARSNPHTDFVLMTRRGRQVQHSTFYRQLKRRACIAGLYPLEPKGREPRSEVTPHSLRRSFATILLNEGLPIDAVADVLGHASLNTTRDHYAFASTERRRSTIEAFHV